MKKGIKFAMLLAAVVAVLAIPVAVDGFCEPDNPDYWCGYVCENGTSCFTDGSQADDTACVWTYYWPGACFTESNAAECQTSCEL